MLRLNRWIVLLAVVTAVRLVIAARLPLTADEAYYWVWSRALAPGYLDHPPMVALWIRAGTALAGETPFGIRLLGPLSAGLGTLLLARAATDLAPASAAGPGLAAAALLNGTVLLNVGTVVMTPDTPLLFFWTATLATLARMLRTGNAAWFPAAGLCLGLAAASKYTAILAAGGLLLWLAATPAGRAWLRRWQTYAAGGLALAAFSPILAWNAAHGWASFAKQGARGGDWHPAEAVRFTAELVAGQAGLATPLILAVAVVGIWRLARTRGWGRDPGAGLILCTLLVPACVFLQHAAGGRVQANWPGILYPGAALAAAMAGIPFWGAAAASGMALSAAIYVQALFSPLDLPRRLDFAALRLSGWADLATAAETARPACGGSLIAADEYGLAAELAWRLPGEVVAAEPRWSLFRLPPVPLGGRTGLLVRSTRRLGPPDSAVWRAVEPVATAVRRHGRLVAETYTLSCVTGAPGASGVRLPHPD